MFSDVTLLFKNKIGCCIRSAYTLLMNSQKCHHVFGSNIPYTNILSVVCLVAEFCRYMHIDFCAKSLF